MIKLIALSFLMMSYSAFSQEIFGYMVDGGEDYEFVIELEKLIADEDYEMKVDLCVVYGEQGDDLPGEQLDLVLRNAGYSLELEGIYGSFGTAVFEVYDSLGEYVAGVSAEVCE